ncbi:hypothetical protein GCM10010517_39660 [Streptosporangium fragile]|uniref:Sporulation protein n=1 Tax=Streptosporangium fragile TaxID=46186 RepID=A0ABP6IIS5_9ACTN
MRKAGMDVVGLVRQVKGAAGVRRVFGEPITIDGVTVIPVAKIVGGGGGGGGGGSTQGDEESGGGAGGGFGAAAVAVGVFAVKDGEVRWRPVVDVNRVIAGGQLVAIVALLTLGAVVRARFGNRPRPS